MTVYIIFHRDPDGCYAGWAARRYSKEVLGVEPVMLSAQYGEPVHELSLKMGDKVYIVDFSYPRDVLDDMYSKIDDGLLVLDHHKSAEEALRGAPYAKFDMSKSGALMAWEEFNPGTSAPYACLLVNDRDLWKWEYGSDTKDFATYCRANTNMMVWNFWDRTLSDDYTRDCISTGRYYSEMEDADVRSFLSHPGNWRETNVYFKGAKHSLAIFTSSNSLISEHSAGLYKKTGVDFTLCWRAVGADISFSMRSPGKAPCDAIARSFGGGGHANSAGFRLPMSEGLALVESIYKNIGKITNIDGDDISDIREYTSIIDGTNKRSAIPDIVQDNKDYLTDIDNIPVTE